MAKVSIATQYLRCDNSFHELLQVLETSNDQAFAQRILDEFGRFRVWAGNSGAHRVGRVSLDYRLREASHLHEELVELLEELNKNLEEAFKLMEGGEGDDSPHMLWEELMAELGPLEGQEAGLSELEYLLSDITHIITWLYKFSIAIRNPAPKERLHKIALINMSHFDYWDMMHIDDKFRPVDPQNNFRVAKYLSERLAKANTRRRQLLKYLEAHHQKISQYIDDPFLSNSSTIERNQLANASKSVMSIAEGGSASTLEKIPTSKSVTTVPTVKTEQQHAVKTKRDEDQLSVTSYATSTNHPMRICVPPPPNENAAFEGKPFQCPYCFNIIEITSRQDWKKHVFEDLQPYVCTFLDCPKADEMFSSQHEWFDHQIQLHWREWYCDTCSECFSQEILFQEHIQMKHSELVTKEHFEAVISRSERANVGNVVCPLCGIELTFQTLEKHLGLHLQEVALFALPRPGPDECTSGSGGKSMKVGYSSDCSSEYSSRKSIRDLDSDGKPSEGSKQIIPPATIEGIRCICSYQHDDGFLITCNQCSELQHGVCVGIDEKNIPEVYSCPACIPGSHNLEIEKAINTQESFLKSTSQAQGSKAEPLQMEATLGSGFIEAAGMNLALFPMVIEGVNFYTSSAEKFKETRHHKHTLYEFNRELEIEESIFKNVWDALMSRTDVLGQPSMDGVLPPDAKKSFINGCLELNTILKELKEKFQRYEQDRQGYMKMFTMIRYFRKEDRNQYIDRIHRLNSNLDKLVNGIPQPPAVEVNKQQAVNIEHYQRVRRHAISLYSALKEHLQVSPAVEVNKQQADNIAEHYQRVRRHAIILYDRLKERLQVSSCLCKIPHSAYLQLDMRILGTHKSHVPRMGRLSLLFPVLAEKVKIAGRLTLRELEFEILENQDFEESALDEKVPDNKMRRLSSELFAPLSLTTDQAKQKVEYFPSVAENHSSYAGSSLLPKASEQIIECFCSTIQNISEVRTSVGVLVSNNAKHQVWNPGAPLISARVASLAELLSLPPPPRIERLKLGVRLASSVLQLHGTEWFQESWGKQDINLIEEGPSQSSSPSLETPVVHQTFTPEPSVLEPSIKSHIIRCNLSLFSLGIVLIELWFWRSEESFQADVPQVYDSPKTTSDTARYIRAQWLSDQLYKDAGDNYGNIVQRCIIGLDHEETQLENDKFKNEAYRKILQPLMTHLELFCDEPLEKIFEKRGP